MIDLSKSFKLLVFFNCLFLMNANRFILLLKLVSGTLIMSSTPLRVLMLSDVMSLPLSSHSYVSIVFKTEGRFSFLFFQYRVGRNYSHLAILSPLVYQPRGDSPSA